MADVGAAGATAGAAAVTVSTLTGISACAAILSLRSGGVDGKVTRGERSPPPAGAPTGRSWHTHGPAMQYRSEALDSEASFTLRSFP